MKKNILYYVAFLLIVSFALFFAFKKNSLLHKKETYNGIELVAQAAAIIKENYVDKVSPEKIFNGALMNMGASLDYFSTFLTEKETNKLNNIKNMGWPGFKFIKKYGFPIITKVYSEYEDKIKIGDIVKIIDGKSTYGIPYLNIKYMLMDKIKTPINIVLLRGEDRKRIKIKLLPISVGYEDKNINEKWTILKLYMIKNSEDYINIERIIKNSKKNIILDLRQLYYINNSEAFKLAKLFLKKDISLKFKLNNSEKEIKIKHLQDNIIKSKNIFVLTDYQTFEEAEMIAYVLKSDGAKIIGSKTLGLSGLIYPLKYKDGSEFLILSGIIKKIYKKGVIPDIKLKKEDFKKFEFNPEKYLDGKKKF
jgi:C-terminal processing protease CtpA/Prc